MLDEAYVFHRVIPETLDLVIDVAVLRGELARLEKHWVAVGVLGRGEERGAHILARRVDVKDVSGRDVLGLVHLHEREVDGEERGSHLEVDERTESAKILQCRNHLMLPVVGAVSEACLRPVEIIRLVQDQQELEGPLASTCSALSQKHHLFGPLHRLQVA